MRIIIASILSLLLLLSCTSITKPSYVDLKPDVSLPKTTKIGYGQRIKLNFSKIDSRGFPYSNKQLGYKMKENMFSTKASTGIFSNNKLIDVVEDNFTKWIKASNFKIVNGRGFNKEVNVKLGYYSFQPVSYLPKIRSAIKITINNSKKREIFSKWYFYEKKYEDTLNNENNEKNINHSIKHLLEDIFRDDNFIYKIQ
jgi:hypothetical protein